MHIFKTNPFTINIPNQINFEVKGNKPVETEQRLIERARATQSALEVAKENILYAPFNNGMIYSSPFQGQDHAIKLQPIFQIPSHPSKNYIVNFSAKIVQPLSHEPGKLYIHLLDKEGFFIEKIFLDKLPENYIGTIRGAFVMGKHLDVLSAADLSVEPS
jgi:hypothetical protein